MRAKHLQLSIASPGRQGHHFLQESLFKSTPLFRLVAARTANAFISVMKSTLFILIPSGSQAGKRR